MTTARVAIELLPSFCAQAGAEPFVLKGGAAVHAAGGKPLVGRKLNELPQKPKLDVNATELPPFKREHFEKMSQSERAN